MTNVSAELDSRFRAAAAEEGLLDVAYDVVDSPLGELFVGISDRGLCVISYEADPDAQVERLARGFGSARRDPSTPQGGSSTSTSKASASGSTSTSTSASPATSAARCSRSSVASHSAR